MENTTSPIGEKELTGTKAKPFSKIALAVFAVLTIIGIACWIYQLVMGHQVTGMSNVSYWGTNIIMFMFFVGLSAGGLIVASSGHVFKIDSFKKVALPAVVTSTVSICIAAAFILVDLGSIQRIFQMLITPNIVSPLVWDMTIIATYLVINILDIVWMVKKDERKVHILSMIALPVAVLVHTITAWIFSLQIGHSWFTAIMGPIFVVSALDSGLAMLLLVLALLKKRGLFTTSASLFEQLSKLLAVFIAIDAYLLICELITMGYPGAGESAALSVMATGASAPFFWFEIVGGLFVPFMILVFAKNRMSEGLIIASSILVVLGVLCKRIWLLLTGFIAPYANGTLTVETAIFSNQAYAFGGIGAFYVPSLIEIFIVIGVISLGVLAFMLMINKLYGGKAYDAAKKVEQSDSSIASSVQPSQAI